MLWDMRVKMHSSRRRPYAIQTQRTHQGQNFNIGIEDARLTFQMSSWKGHDSISPHISLPTHLQISQAHNLLTERCTLLPEFGTLQILAAHRDILDLIMKASRAIIFNICQDATGLIDSERHPLLQDSHTYRFARHSPVKHCDSAVQVSMSRHQLKRH